MRTVQLVALAVVLLAGPAAAQDHGGAGGVHGAMDSMQGQMGAVPMTGDPDVDFARMMILHHQGAIDMARAELAHGKDPELRRLAEEIIAAQEREIAFLEQWLQSRGN